MGKARTAWRLHAALAAAGLGITAALLLAAIAAAPSTRPVAVAEACWRLFLPRLTVASVAALALGSAAFAVVLLGARSALRQALASTRLHARTRHAPVRRVVGHRVRVLDSPHALAYTAGILCPRIHLSRGALERLSARQLRAVLAHEAHHAARRDPLRLFVARVARDALFFVPALRALHDRHAVLAELEADAAAVSATGGPAPLAAALLAFEESAPSAAVGIDRERVDQLLGGTPRLGLPAALVAGTVVTMLAAGAAVVLVAASADHDGALTLPAAIEQLCVLARALLPLAGGAALLAAGRLPWLRRPAARRPLLIRSSG